ncbi:MAG: AraC family transcriptional regulator [Candidatus Fimivivens sp.]|nr:AraC family transcriptional regulator [Candidatus Fimivivens sp.]
MTRHYAERFSLAQLSEQYHISSSYLNGKFKNATGYAINDFVNRYRILRSMLLLTGSDMRIYEVAQAVGFEDYKYFIMVFKKYMGVPPAKFFETADRAPGEPDSGRPAQTEKE